MPEPQTLDKAIRRPVTLTAAIVLVITLGVFTVQFGSDGPRWLLWTVTLILLGLPVLPLSLKIFHNAPEAAFPFSMALGFLLTSFISWTLSYLHILPFAGWALLLIIAVLSAVFWIPKFRRERAALALTHPDTLPSWLVFTTVFALGTGAWSYVRGLMPNIDGLEKFMDYGFMMSMWRTSWLPAADMWFAGHSINYYYYGQFAYTMAARLTGIHPSFAYNLSMGTTVGFMLMLSSALGFLLFSFSKERSAPFYRTGRWLAALFSGFLVTVAGNSHSFFYGEGAPGNRILHWLNEQGIDVGNPDAFFFSDSTRYIGYNPDTADKTIHEFPYYSFLVADLHAHLANTVFVLLLVGIVFAYYEKRGGVPKNPDGRTATLEPRRWLGLLRAEPVLLLSGILLAVFMMGNFWDFAIYYVVILFVFLSRNLRDEERSGGIFGVLQLLLSILVCFIPFLVVTRPSLALISYLGALAVSWLIFVYRPNALSRTGLELAFLFFIAHLASLPFNINFEPISKTIKLVTQRSTPQQLLILWGPHVLIAVIGSLMLLIRAARQPKVQHEGLEQDAVRKTAWPFLEQISAGSWLAVLLTISGIGLILAPEVIYVRDIYEANYARANTMFKFTYQGFILLGLAAGFFLAKAIEAVVLAASARKFEAVTGKDGKAKIRKNPGTSLPFAIVIAAVMLLLTVMPARYPFVATPGWVPNPGQTEWRGLDGTSWMDTAMDASGTVSDTVETYDLTPDAAAIDWLNENVGGQPTILEAAGLSYTHLNRISAYTGLPTVLGWETHEWLWRSSSRQPHAYAEVIYPTQQDILAVYTWSDPARAVEFLRIHEVEYIIVGELEALRYPDLNVTALEELGEVVFRQGAFEIIQINPDTIG